MSSYIAVDGPVDADRTLIRYDVPFAPEDPKRSLKLRQRLGLAAETRDVDANVRVVIDSFLVPRTWEENGVRWVQHASPYPTSRIETVQTKEKLKKLMKEMGGKSTGICPIRSMLYGECFLEVIRQVAAECWERGLLLLKVHAERVESQTAHRDLFESRTGYAFRLALKGEKDTGAMIRQIEDFKRRSVELSKEEEVLSLKCEEHKKYAEEQILIDEKKFNDEINVLKKEGTQKKNQLDSLTAPIKR
ncbi:dynein light arm chain, putative [Bodo saltans]|uniref:Dynein light arm chain, putative n=1 Tax=Bodo saltans TaxID=75058 RepID=A0A0S4KGN7_BODSA|nr:dynein light arm chain, putative [Bodo saltans]|eukprot:CUI14871.1 dynein light arm chain, putative [Bodo saltans]